MANQVGLLREQLERLHGVLESKGINSRGKTDIKGRPFDLPVNAEHKATVFNMSTLCSNAQPHMRVFWSATFGFFCTFFSVFAPSALGPYLRKARKDGGLGLTPDELSTAGNLAVSGTIVMRVIAGPMCDLWGVRKTFISLLLIAIPGMIVLITAQGSESYIIGRFIVGLSLATFVTCQVWCSQLFDRRVVGVVNATAGGWGNVGGGITLLLMPEVMNIFLSLADGNKTEGEKVDWAWRMCFIVPIVLHVVASLYIMTARDLADGNYTELEEKGYKSRQVQGSSLMGGLRLILIGFTNTNGLIMLVTYGLCFGVELTMNNKLTLFFDRYYAQSPRTASQLAASFSLMNLFARSWGGILSDWVAIKGGIRARITAMWVIQTLEGVMCILLGLVTYNLSSPDEPAFRGAEKVQGVWTDTSGFDDVVYTLNGSDFALNRCASDWIFAPAWVPCPWDPLLECRFPVKGYITIKDPDPNCIHNGNTLGLSIFLILIFSIFVQMAEGLHFGVVPFLSRPILGVISGMVGAGGNLGAVISGQFIVGSGSKEPLDRGFVYLGIVIITLSMLMHLIFIPGAGGILLPKTLRFDPQLVKPRATASGEMRGSDEIDFESIHSQDNRAELNGTPVDESDRSFSRARAQVC